MQDWDVGRLDSDLGGAAFDTLVVRAGQRRTSEGEHGEALFTTSSYVFRTTVDAAARFVSEVPGNAYSCYTNPMVHTFEEYIAALEGAEQTVATASDMSAILVLVMSLCSSGDHVLAPRNVLGSTISLFDKYFKRFGIQVDYPPLSDLTTWEAACKPNIKLFFVEPPSSPLAELVDIAALVETAHAKDTLLAVDNCFCTPVLRQPLKLGADVVIHSATKYINGRGRGMGGVAAGYGEQMKEVVGLLHTAGSTLSLFSAWLFLKGLETLCVRIQARSVSALALAEWLEHQPGVERVYYAGLQSHPQHELTRRQQNGFGAVVSFDVEGGRDAAQRFIDATWMVSIIASLGDTKTIITHLAITSHGWLSSEDRARAGIGDSLIRVAVGSEDLDDPKVDMARGLTAL